VLISSLAWIALQPFDSCLGFFSACLLRIISFFSYVEETAVRQLQKQCIQSRQKSPLFHNTLFKNEDVVTEFDFCSFGFSLEVKRDFQESKPFLFSQIE